MRKFAKFVRNPLPGEKNGRKIGNMCFIAVSGAEEVNIKWNKIAYYIDYWVLLYSLRACLLVNNSPNVKTEHNDNVTTTTFGFPSKNVDPNPLTTNAINVERAPIIDDAYPAMWPKGFIARAFKLPKINPKKEKLIIIKIENQTKFEEK